MNPDNHRATLIRTLEGGAVACPIDAIGVMRVEGADAASFLKGQLSGDVDTLVPGQSQRSSYNTPKGRMLASLRVWKRPAAADREGFGVLLAADLVESVRKRLSMFVLRAKVSISDVTGSCRLVGIAGARGAAALTSVFGAAPAPDAIVEPGNDITLLGLPDGRFVVIAPTAATGSVLTALAAVATTGDDALWRWLDIRAGVPLVTAATSDLFVAQMLNWDALDGVRAGKGCYPGQEIIARMRSRGGLKERLFAFHAEDAPPAAGTRLYSPAFGEQPCGTVVAAAPAPEGGSDLLAVTQIAAAEAGALALGATTGPALAPLALPYALPPAVRPRERLG